jgi:hypothetical protein
LKKWNAEGAKKDAKSAEEQEFSGILRNHCSGGEVERGEGGDDLLGFEGDGDEGEEAHGCANGKVA